MNPAKHQNLARALWLCGKLTRGAWLPVASALGASAVLVGTAPASASLVEALDLDALVAEAEQVVLARVVSMNSRYDDRGQIVTDVVMQVEEALKGDSAPGAAVVVRRLGGVVNGLGMRVSGEPTFDVGETVLVFGKTLKDGATLRTLGMAQGALRVFERDGMRWARSSAGGVSAVRRDGGKLKSAALAVEEPRPLDDLMAEIRDRVRKSKR